MVYCTNCKSNGTGAFSLFQGGLWQIIGSLTCERPTIPLEGSHIPSITQIIWNWETVPCATGYKWNIINDEFTATDIGAATSTTETGLSCNTSYTRYVWAYNACGNSNVKPLIQNTSLDPPASPIAGSHIAYSGQIVWNWNPVIGAIGYKWSTTNNYATATDMGANTSKTETYLTCSVTYLRYIWAYNICGSSPVATMNQLTSSCSGLPTVTTSAISDITQTTAISGGNVLSDGGETVIFRGVCWGINVDPTISDNNIANGGGTGVFVSNLTGMTANTLYYVRAYAINSNGTAFGNTLTLISLPTVTTTAATNITQITATSGGNISAGGGVEVLEKGVCWSTTVIPTVIDNHTTDGTGAGVFISYLTGLTGNTVYYLRAYLTNSSGTFYGNQKNFTTSPILPTVTTAPVTNLTSTNAVSGGSVSSDGGATVTTRGLCWSTTPNPTISNNNTTNGTGIGVFISNLTSLTPNTIYYLRAYAINSVGTSYGNELTFTTLVSPILPIVVTTPITNIISTKVTIGGNILSDGGETVSFRGVCWGIGTNPTISDNYTTDGNGTGIFVSNIIGMTANTIYYVRAYAVNSVGISYGNEVMVNNTNYIGNSYGGGIIFYIDATWQHGLIASTSDQGTGTAWGCEGTNIGGTSTSIGTGQTNTTAIVNGCSQAGIAARICDDLLLNGYSDWFLPSSSELNQIYLKKNIIGGFADDVYWSSSEYSANNAYYQNLISGGTGIGIRSGINGVRAIRAF
jgi:hypothetical protein